MLGYINFAGGKPDARFEKQISDAYDYLTRHGVELPWDVLRQVLREKLLLLNRSGAGGFANIDQAEAVLSLVFDHALPAYRQHHADLLFHLSDRDLIQPFFLARVFEAVLSQGGPWAETDRIVTKTISQL